MSVDVLGTISSAIDLADRIAKYITVVIGCFEECQLIKTQVRLSSEALENIRNRFEHSPLEIKELCKS